MVRFQAWRCAGLAFAIIFHPMHSSDRSHMAGVLPLESDGTRALLQRVGLAEVLQPYTSSEKRLKDIFAALGASLIQGSRQCRDDLFTYVRPNCESCVMSALEAGWPRPDNGNSDDLARWDEQIARRMANENAEGYVARVFMTSAQVDNGRVFYVTKRPTFKVLAQLYLDNVHRYFNSSSIINSDEIEASLFVSNDDWSIFPDPFVHICDIVTIPNCVRQELRGKIHDRLQRPMSTPVLLFQKYYNS